DMLYVSFDLGGKFLEMSVDGSVPIGMGNIKCFSIPPFRNFYSGHPALTNGVYRQSLSLLRFYVDTCMKMVGAQFSEGSGQHYWNVQGKTKIILWIGCLSIKH